MGLSTAWKKFVHSLAGGIPHSDKRFVGLKITTVGYLLAMIGMAMLFGSAEELGKAVAYVGGVIFIVGFVTQAIIMLFTLK